MLTYSYYPGCTLRTKAKELDAYARASAAALGVELVELPEWQCCGGVYSSAGNEPVTKLAAVRALIAARDAGTPLVTVCSACYNVLAQVNHELRTNPAFAAKVAQYLELATPYTGETEVLHLLQVLRDHVGFEAVRAAVKHPLTDRRIAPYYGCLLLRPGKVLQFDDPENPQTLEALLTALGATPVITAERNECCGGYRVVEDAAFAGRRSDAIAASAADFGAELLITACPLCRYNLQKTGRLPVVYFTELLAEALGVKEAAQHG